MLTRTVMYYLKEAKVFTCEGPYPLDAYVRWSLRKRGWVEKFGQRGNSSSSRGTSGKLACENDEGKSVYD